MVATIFLTDLRALVVKILDRLISGTRTSYCYTSLATGQAFVALEVASVSGSRVRCWLVIQTPECLIFAGLPLHVAADRFHKLAELARSPFYVSLLFCTC
jgi:hypothetical protein